MPLCTTILDKWLYVCRRSTSKGLLAAFLCLPNGRCNAAIAHLARTTVFLKNMRLSTPERLFFSKTSDCQPPNERFSQKHAIVNPRTGRCNDATAHIDPRIVCCKAQQLILPIESFVARRNSSYCPPNRLLQGATAHIDPRIGCCKAQQLILTPESFVARRNSSYCPPNWLLQGATGVYSKHATRATASLHCLLHF